MSQENVELVRVGFAAWNAGDMEAFGELYDADVILQPVRLHALSERLGNLLLKARVGVDDVPMLRRRDVRHAAPPNCLKIHCTPWLRSMSTPHRYTPKNTDTRITTTVVA